MGQIIINTGNVANDGLGTPLRNAFDQVNYNFTQLFNAGPSGSNIVIANNSITVTNTNGNLNLATNGVGSIVPKANFVPDIPDVRSLGAGTNRFNTVYAQYINANTGTFAGNVYVAGNLQVTGNVVTVNYSNLSVANSNITLATGAANASQANGGGLLIPIAGANLTYNYSANRWNSTIAIAAPTFIGDGANLTNVIANVQANALLGNTFSNAVNYSNLTSFGLVSALSATGNLSTTGNVYANVVSANSVTANYLVGNGSNITNITANAIVGNVPFALVANTAYVANLAALATQAINADTALFAINANLAAWANTATVAQTANAATYAVQADNANSAVVAGMAYELAPTADLSITGNITTGGFFIGDGGLISNIVVTTSYGNSNVAVYLPTDTTIIGIQSNVSNTSNNVANLTTSLGNTNSNVSNNTSNITTLQGQVYANSNVSNYLQNLTTNVSTTGNVTANYFIGNGSQLTGIVTSSYGNANVVANLAALGSNPISTTGNVTANYFIGNGSQLTSLPAPVVTQDITSNGAMSIMTYDGNIKYVNYVTVEPSSGNIAAGNISTTGNISGNYFVGNGSQLTGISTANTGNVTFSGEAVIGTGTSNTQSGLYLAPDPVSLANDLYLRVRGNIYDEPTHIHFDTGNNQYFNQFIGDDNKYIQLANTGNIVINTSDYVGNTAQWMFGTDGVLTLPHADASGFGNIYFEENSSTITFGLDDNTIPYLYSFATSGITLPTGGARIRDTVGNAVAFGRDAAATGPQGNAAVAIGQNAGDTSQGQYSVAIGYQAGLNTQGTQSVSVGPGAGQNGQGAYSVAVGDSAGTTTQGIQSVAVGQRAGFSNQSPYAVAIGAYAGNSAQGERTVAVGLGAGTTSQGNSSIAIGAFAGNSSQGTYSIAIGANAGDINQANNSIILNAMGGPLNQTTANTFTVAPVRNDTSNIAEVMFYNTTSKEITYGNTISVAGNVTGGNIGTSGSGGNITLSGGNITGAGNISASGNINAANFIGNLVSAPTYGAFYDTTTQTNSNVGNAIPISYNTVDINNGVTIAGNTQITIAETGIYNIQFSLQVRKTDAGADAVYVWLDKNGNRVANTGTSLYLIGDNAAEVAAWNFVVSATANDYYRLMWMSPDSHVEIVAVTAGAVVPAIPSVILTVVPVGV